MGKAERKALGALAVIIFVAVFSLVLLALQACAPYEPEDSEQGARGLTGAAGAVAVSVEPLRSVFKSCNPTPMDDLINHLVQAQGFYSCTYYSSNGQEVYLCAHSVPNAPPDYYAEVFIGTHTPTHVTGSVYTYNNRQSGFYFLETLDCLCGQGCTYSF